MSLSTTSPVLQPVPAHASELGLDPEQLEAARIRLELLYGEVAASWPGFIARPGQYEMMQASLLTFLSAKAPDDEKRNGNNLAQLEAGTGTGKTVAYCLAAIVASELLKKTVIVSTATVALQEQLFHKDLPRLAEIIPELRYDILKGRARYVCESRLEGVINDEVQDSLLNAEFQDAFADARRQAKAIPRDRAEAMLWFKNSAKKLHNGSWDGDIDSLAQPPDAEDWRQVQANAHACNGGQCEYFRSCAFFKARRQAASATLQVANHALVLATLQTDSTLIDPGNTLFVFDEAHHLPQIAADQFSYRARLGTSSKLLTSLRTVALRHGRVLPASTRPDPVAFAQLITGCTDKLALLERYWIEGQLVSADKAVHRFAQGRIPEDLIPECEQLASLIGAIRAVVASIAAALTEPDESQSPNEREEQSRAGVELGVYLSRLDTLEKLFGAWATHDKVPWAKWLEWADGVVGTTPDVWLCASPMTAAQVLSKNLWKNVSAAVCTSATLTACGSFDFFERLSGMNRFPERRALVVASPFDYAVQGELRIAPMQHSPKSPGFSDELCEKLPGLLREHQHGQLALFTSRRQMQACHAALPKDLAEQVQVQGVRSRTELLKEHSRRIVAGERSIIFGLQSFGEGIDLPGQLCEHVLIDKLPFTPPNSPVEEALAEWLNVQGRDPFNELSVPRAGMKLAQWAGRGVRTVTDRAVITVCDTRLVNMRYGQAILAGLPPFPVVR
ncbi:ATP-dependent DNA helicase DinG [Polaromonas sp. OV174]|uniref:ATP-dependent DNA helicase DinG n=1 Tax=Polaromonas sp. OV174 TaxID=1855300 RepID=UPI0015A55465|nr:ATP-dependent DNA helicase DinG [Polaromonas sp. OV174]